MFEVFSQRLDTELGQINPAWFEELTAKASHGHGGAVIADRAEVLCPLSSYAQNDIGKTPGGVFGSQMFSTPKLFQHRGLCSPDLTQNEESHTPNQGPVGASHMVPWADSSPFIFGSAKDSQPFKSCGTRQPTECLGLNDTPKSSLAQSAKRISESLGAQINPDLSWSSSFNTPSAITPTVILSNKEDQSSPTRPSHDKNVIFVRELFPSVTNSCTGAKPLTENTATCPDDEICQDDGGKLCGSPDNINNVWEQKVPHAISDGDVRTTVENVLDGAEDVLSIFFSNSGPALRRVKNKERIKRAQSESAKENPQALPAERTKELNETPKRATYKKQGFAASETNNSVKLTEFGCIQWTPISLSEISDTSDQSCPTQSAPLNKCVVNQSDRPDDVTFDPARSQKTSQLSVSMAEKLNSPGCLVSPSSILIRTPRRFVYHVTSSHAAKPEVNHGSLLPGTSASVSQQGYLNDKPLDQRTLLSAVAKESGARSGLDIRNELVQKGSATKETVVPTTLSEDCGFDMTQLCRAFSENFSQDVGIGDKSVKHGNTSKMEDIEGKSQSLDLDSSDLDQRLGYSRHVEDQFHSGVKMTNNKIISQEAKEGTKTSLDEFQEYSAAHDSASDGSLFAQVQSKQAVTRLNPQNDCSPNHTSKTISKAKERKRDGRISNLRSDVQKIQNSFSSLGERGFKTFADGIRNGSSSQEVKSLFKDIEPEPFLTSSTHDLKGKQCIEISEQLNPTCKKTADIRSEEKGSGTQSHQNLTHQLLTASQKADVSELCSLLEEADSQYEFTQFKAAKQCSDPHHKGSQPFEKEWDADILSGIDFDDSFDEQLMRKHHVMTGILNKPTTSLCGEQDQEESKHSVDMSGSHDRTGKMREEDALRVMTGCRITPSPPSAHLYSVPECTRAESIQTTTKGSSDTDLGKSFHVGFKTGRGEILRVSERCLSTARTLFADLDESSESFAEAYKKMPDIAAREQEQSCPSSGRILSLPSIFRAELGHNTEKTPQASSVVIHANLKHCGTGGNSMGSGTKSELELTSEMNLTKGDKNEDLNKNRITNVGKKTEAVDIKSDSIWNHSLNSSFAFSTASGKMVEIPENALLHAQSIVREAAISEETEILTHVGDKRGTIISSEDQHSTKPVLTASLRGCHMLEEMLVLLDSSNETETKNESAKLHLDVSNNNPEGLKQKFGNGFMTASGKGVTVSTKALQEAKTIFKDRDLDSPATAQTELEKSGVKCDYSNDKGNCTEDGTGVAAPEISQTAQSHRGFNEHPRAEFTTASFEICYFRSSCGFSTASGRSVSVSTEAIQKSRTLFADLDDTSFCENVKEMKKCENLKMETSATNKGGGFSTASGRKVFISETALQKAKNMFNECDDKTFESEKILVDSMKNSAPDPGQKMCFGFSTASGKGVTISEKALQEAKSMFMGCDDDDFSDIGEPITWGTSGEKKHSDRHRGHQERACIGGPDGKSSSIMERVPVGASIVPGISNSLQDEHFESDKPGINKFGFNTASGKRVCVSRQAQGEALERFRDCSDLLEQPQKSKDSVPLLPSLTDKGFAPPTTQKDLSSLKSDPVAAGVGTIVDTQQEFSQLEAEACAKALLEDEGFREQATSVSRVIRESPHNHAPAKLNNRTRKRMLDSSIIEENLNHLPLKRRLLDDFAQRTDDVRCSDCIPVRSSPNGTLKDRRVFKYTVPLRPNVTHPDRTAVDHKPNKPESFAVLNSKPCSSKAAFVPPFRKNGKTDVQKNCVSQKATKHPSMFVPPLQKKDERSLHSSPDSHPMKRLEFQSIITDNDEKKLGNECNAEQKREREGLLEEQNNEMGQAEILQSVQLARDVQDMRIRKKKHQSVQPVPGSLFLAKSSGLPRVSVREAVGLTRPARYTSRELYECGVPYQVIQVSSENAESFRFQFEHFFGRNVCVDAGGVRVGDGGWLIPDNALTVGKEEFFRALCDTPGVDPRLISEAWVYNHYRWIVWKLASMERSFPAMMGGRCLTLERVLLQLKYRYDVEVDHCQRSALKKIMERDDTPAKTLVLCVCGIATLSNGAENPSYAENGPSPGRVGSRGLSAIVWVTDGWYTIKALLDPPLSAMLRKGRLAVGGKIVTHGAELVGSQDACSPLEAPESLMLKIWANSTRRARWDVRLGFQRDPRPFPLSLSSLYSDGGSVGCVDIVVLRSYPTQWMEKKSSGVFVFRNDRAEEREARKHSETRQKDMELLFSRIQAQFESEERGKSKCRGRMRTLSVLEIEAMQDGEELYDAVEADPLYLEAHLSEKQLEILSSYRRVLAERRHTDLQEQFRKAVQENEGCCPDRDVTPVWKLSVRDSSDTHCSSVYTLNIWRPSPDLRALLREGSRYKVCHLSTSEGKKQAGKATTQFTITKKTQFERMQVCPEWLHHRFQARQSANFKDLQNPAFHSPCEEVDIVGYVVSILDRHGTSPVLYLVDENHNFVSVRSKSSLTQLALDDLVKPLALLAISNLQLKQPRAPIPCLYAGDLALFSTSPKEPHLQEATGRLKTFAQGREYFFTLAEEKLSSLVPLGGSNTAHFPRTPGMPVRLKPSSSFNGPAPQAETELSQCLPVNKRPHPSLNTPENKDPKTLKRKRSLDYLLRVPSPPALSPLGTVISPCVSKTFNPPRRCKTPRVGHTAPAGCTAPPPVEDDWVNDEEMAMINTQALLDRVGETGGAVKPS